MRCDPAVTRATTAAPAERKKVIVADAVRSGNESIGSVLGPGSGRDGFPPEQRALRVLGTWAERQSAVKVGVFVWLLSTLVAAPALFGWSWETIALNSRAADYLRLCADPLTRDLNEPILAYRIAVPLLAWALQLPPIAALVLPYLAHVGFLGFVFVALRRRSTATLALLGTTIVGLSFALFWSNWRPGFTDTFTHLAVGAMLVSSSARVAGLATLLGFLNDERMVLALPFVFLWHLPSFLAAENRRTTTTRWVLAVFAAAVVYAGLRYSLQVGWIGTGVPRPVVYQDISAHIGGFRPHLGSWTVWGLNVFLSFRWAWVLVFAWLILGWREGSRVSVSLAIGALAGGVLASAVVADVARSVGFLFPLLLVAIAGLASRDPQSTGVWLLRIVTALLATPVFFTFEHFQIHWFRPLPLVLWRCWREGHTDWIPF